jgi:hypothetical protein
VPDPVGRTSFEPASGTAMPNRSLPHSDSLAPNRLVIPGHEVSKPGILASEAFVRILRLGQARVKMGSLPARGTSRGEHS